MKISYRVVVFSFLTPPSAHLLDLGLGLGRRLRERAVQRVQRRPARDLIFTQGEGFSCCKGPTADATTST
jgi:hypothetical protein